MTLPYEIAPAGIGASGIYAGVPVIDIGRPPIFLADDIDPTTGDLRSVLTGDDPIDAAILWQLRARRGSGSAVVDVGQDFQRVKTNIPSAAEELRHEALLIVTPFERAGHIDEVKITAEAGPEFRDNAAVLIEYRNKRRGARVSRRI